MVMTFVLHPLSRYNSIIEPCARFLLSFIEDLTIDFPSHFILFLINVYKDTTTCDKLIFSSASTITRIICHSSISYPEFAHFTIMGAISAVSVRRNEAQLRLKQPWTETATPLTHSTSSTSTPSSSAGGVMHEAIMSQLQRMDAHLDTLTDEMSQVTTHVGRIARCQAHLGGFVASPSPSPQALEDENDDDGSSDDDDDDDDEDEDEDASSSGNEEMTASQ